MANQFIQGNLSHPGNFEAVVWEEVGGTKQLIHYYRDNNDPKFPWYPQPSQTPNPNDIISRNAGSQGALIQSTFNTPQHPGSFEVLVAEGPDVVHYYRDNSNTGNSWVKDGVIP